MLGGRAAEEFIFNEQTIGASSDIERATSLARKMVTEFGMSSLGPISFDASHGSNFLARELGEGPHYSEETAAKIDNEIKKIIDDDLIETLSPKTDIIIKRAEELYKFVERN
jgi:cell division protease FtsH